jgi:hypothetical protein
MFSQIEALKFAAQMPLENSVKMPFWWPISANLGPKSGLMAPKQPLTMTNPDRGSSNFKRHEALPVPEQTSSAPSLLSIVKIQVLDEAGLFKHQPQHLVQTIVIENPCPQDGEQRTDAVVCELSLD